MAALAGTMYAPPSVLIVEDQELLREMVADQLRDEYACHGVATVQEAKHALSHRSFDLILCDIHLPDGCGLKLSEEILRGSTTTAVMLMTGDDDPDVARRAFDFGIHGYLIKPFSRGQLLIAVMNGLRRYQLELEEQAHARALADQLQTVIDRAPMPIYAKDRSLRYVLANRSAREKFQLSANDLIGATDDMLLSAEEARHARAVDREVLERGEVYEEQETLLISGEERTFVTVKFPLLDEDGRITAVCAVSPEVTAQREAEQLRSELARAQARAIEELLSSRLETVERLARALELSDPNLGHHVHRMALIAAFLGRKAGLDEHRVELLRAAAVMHDVGKIGVPASVLGKTGSLTAEERAEMQRHAEIGYEILAGSDSELLCLAATIALTHHERFDGRGYPRGLVGTTIPLEGRIAALADVFDALLSDRSYRPALPMDEVVQFIVDGKGSKFDPQLVDLLLEHLDEALELRSQA